MSALAQVDRWPVSSVAVAVVGPSGEVLEQLGDTRGSVPAGLDLQGADAAALADLVLDFHARTGLRPRLSLIPYNPIGDADPFTRSPDDIESDFRDALAARGVFTHKRYSGGGDVDAACGQLAARA